MIVLRVQVFTMSHIKRDGAHDFLCSLMRTNEWRLCRKKCSKVCKRTIDFVNKIIANVSDCNHHILLFLLVQIELNEYS